jgi:fucose permease
LTLISIVYILTIRAINASRDVLLKGHEVTEEDEVITFSRMITSFKVDWVVSLGFLCALSLEISVGDWATIIARQEFNVSKSIAVTPYFLFMAAMIIGRLAYSRIKGSRSDKEIVQPFVVLGGTIFLTSLTLSMQIKESNLALGYIIFCLGFFLTGFGISFVGPLFFGYASARSDKPAGVAVAELGALNQGLSFIVRGIISLVAGVVGLPIAMAIPGIMLILVAFFVTAASQPKRA